MKSTFHVLLGTALSLGILYGVYWVFKSFSYWLFYEGMVKNTIIEMVQQGALR
jgi:hypothetical protein